MKRMVALLLAAWMLLFAACAKQTEEAAPARTEKEEIVAAEEENLPEEAEDETAAFDYRGYDWLSLIESEVYDDSDLSTTLRELVSLEITDASASDVTLSVTAPDIYEDLTAWFNAVSDAEFSVEALDAKVRELLGGETKTQEFTVPYDLVGDVPVLYYPEECLHAVSAGMLTFYYDLYADMVEEVEAMEGA